MTTNIKSFVEAVKTVMESRLSDYDFTEQDIVKMNDLTLHALVARRHGEDAGATLYLDEAFEDFGNGETMESIADSLTYIVKSAEAVKPMAVASDIDLSFDAVKDRLTFRLVDTAKNRAYLKEHPFRAVGAGLAVVAEINLGNDYSTVVNNSLAENYDIDTLFDTALENMQMLYPAQMVSLEGAIFGDSRNVLDSDEHIEGMYTLMIGEDHGFGAGTLVYSGIAERVRELFGGDFFVLPSSVHETILLKDDGTANVADLKAMVMQANRSVVAPADVLSDSVFRYGAEGLRRVA